MTTLYEDSPIANLLAMVERCAPKMMRCGGGSLEQNTNHRKAGSVTPEMKQRIVEMARSGAKWRDIADAVGVSQGYAWKVAHRNAK